ncbi:SdpI family protein [Tenacibaculum salmonis]|uniref:SdpI family protein n=1 Tax=Tenacibaculum sp. P3-BQ1 TaxID=3232310 RepID=UPI0034DF2F68
MNPYYYVLSVNGFLFLFSIIFYFFPPKKINPIYGYRTNKTIKNNIIWQFANSFFTKQFLIYSSISFVATLILAFISKNLSWQPMAIMLLSLAVSVIKTEQEISKNFDDDGNKLK